VGPPIGRGDAHWERGRSCRTCIRKYRPSQKRVCLERGVYDWEACRGSGIFFIAEKLRWIILVGAHGSEVSMRGVSHGLSHVSSGVVVRYIMCRECSSPRNERLGQ
jgi:hypothetical protein